MVMAVYKISDTSLNMIASAIKNKSGVSGKLSIPNGFVTAINSITTDGGKTEWWDTSDPTDSNTHFWIEFPKNTPTNRLNFSLCFQSSIAQNVRINWGDDITSANVGSDSLSTINHTYSAPGQYEIVLTVEQGNISFSGTTSSNIVGSNSGVGKNKYLLVKRIHFGSGINATTGLGQYALSQLSNLLKVTFPSNVTTYSSNLMRGCTSLTKLTIPESVISIGSNAFYNLSWMTEYHFLGIQPPTIATNTFYGLPSDCIIYVPKSVDHVILETYQEMTNWVSYSGQIQEEP